MSKVFHRLAAVYEVFNILSRYVSLEPQGVEYVGLGSALWRVLAEDVYAPNDSPPFDRSEVDGYAVVAESLSGADEDNPVRLKVIGASRIGQVPNIEVRPGEAVDVDTGAVIPRGANAVVMTEYCRRVGDYVYVYKSVAPGENIAYCGSDVMKGELILTKGTLLTPRELPLLAAVGIYSVKVYKRPRVALISIGSELKKPGEPLNYGEVYDVNTYSISSLLEELHIKPTVYGIVGDDYQSILNILSEAMKFHDIIITSGGTSAGAADITYKAINDLGEPGVIIHGLKVRPGKPTVVGVVNNKILIGLPGFPLSAVMIFILIVKPLLLKLMGVEYVVNNTVKAHLSERITGSRGRELLLPVSLVINNGKLVAYPIPITSGSVSVFTRADGFIRIPENTGVVHEDTPLDVYLLSSSIKPADLVIIGSHDYGVNIALNLIKPRPYVKLINVGSLSGLLAVSRGEADIAGTHLLDDETYTYNIPFIKRLKITNVVLVKGYLRNVGLIVKQGNPKNIRGVEDLLRDDIVFINRNRGSGTRTLLDVMLKGLARSRGVSFEDLIKRIRGYTTEAKTHTAVAAAVAQGRADVGLGIEAAANMYGLEFIKLHTERYDFIVGRGKLDKPYVRMFINILKDERFHKELTSRLKGYEVPNDIGEVIEVT